MTPPSVRSATRRFVALTALRWLPVGLTIPVMVLLASSRGLTLIQIALVSIVHSVTVACLELPTGGLADAVGRRPVLVASGLLHLGSCAAFVAADGVAGFAFAMALMAVGRALDSGPLEAWYVDTVHGCDPRADVVPGLSRAGIADCLALSAGAVTGGLLPALLEGGASSLLVLPFVAAALLDLVSIIAVLVLVTPTGPARTGSALQSVRRGLAAVPATVTASVALSVRDGALRTVLLLSAVCGLCLGTLELLGPGLFADLAGSRTGGSAVFGLVMAASFLAGAAGAALAPTARRLTRGSLAWAVTGLTALSGMAVAGVAAGDTVLLAAAAYCCFYLANAAAWPLLHAVLHARVGADRRASVLSASSLALMLGGATSSLINPRLVEAGGRPAAYLLVGAATVGAGLLALRLRSGYE
ncbi:MAG: MFS transporter, partial [Actinomycetota bacterium]|nr:MFS transporter [Actinomycetota bacterium]